MQQTDAMNVNKKVVIVTGGNYGIGRGITVTLAERGYAVVAFGLDERQTGSQAQNGTEGTRQELEARGLNADLLVANLRNDADVRDVVRFTLEKYGRIDGLVNNAAIRPTGNILETSEEDWDAVIDVNLKGIFRCTRAVLPRMIQQGGGAIVNVGSASGWGRPDLFAYCASKGGVFGLSMALAYDHLHDHVRVNVVVPGGGTVTGMTEGLPTLLERAGSKTVAGRNTTVRDVANGVAFLLSDEAENISGTILTVGGFLNQGGPIRARKPS